MRDTTQTIKRPLFIPRTSLQIASPATWFGIGICLIALAPILSIAPWLQTYIHPWRPELISSFVVLALLIWGFNSQAFKNSFKDLSKTELLTLVAPCAIFTVVSALSAFYAGSWRSVAHHTLVWCVYIVFYFFARHFIASSSGREAIALATAGLVWVIGLPAVIEYYTGGISGSEASIGIRYAKYAELLNALFPVFAALCFRLKGRMFWLGAATLGLMWTFVLSTTSRSAIGLYLVGALTLIAAVFIFKRFKHYRGKATILIAIMILVPALSEASSYFMPERMTVADRMRDTSVQESNNVRPFFASISLEMFRSNLLTGVGADNFGAEFHKYRAQYAAANPSDTRLTIAESELPERAHNEYMQIAAELGLPGVLTFGALLAGLAWLFVTALIRRKRITLTTMAALIGILLFLVSSLVTSYSFRLVQNGLVFFVLLALAAHGLLSFKNVAAGKEKNRFPVKAALSIGIAACCLLASLSIVRAYAAVSAINAESTIKETGDWSGFQRAISLDKDNASAYSAYGFSLFVDGQYEASIKPQEEAIAHGRATSVDYSYLASSHLMAGNKPGAAGVLAEGIKLYPYSVFLRSRYGVLLNELGRSDEAQAQFDAAMKIDARQAITWRNLAESGPVVASKKAFDENLLPVMDLKPIRAIYAMVHERELTHPEEKFDFKF